MPASDYELIDFGDGRKLERFGDHVLDRPSPAAEGTSRRVPGRWLEASARYHRAAGSAGSWELARPIVDGWSLDCGGFTLGLKLTEAGHLGAFPEQTDNWRWIAEQVGRLERPKVLNLFAYTGASTLAAAAAGAEVVHVDAASSAVSWARRNAELSKLSDAPVRWIVEDALRFVTRERRRGRRYDGIVLDPPAYGHGPKGQPWKLTEHLPELLAGCWELCGKAGQFLLLSCHSAELATADGLLEFAAEQTPPIARRFRPRARDLELRTGGGAALHCGATIRWTCQ